MSQEQPYQITESDIAYAVAQTLNGFSTAWLTNADALLPNPKNPGHPAVVVTAADGSRYGLEVCKIPEPHALPNTPLGEPDMTTSHTPDDIEDQDDEDEQEHQGDWCPVHREHHLPCLADGGEE